jgi:benzylsuccinate CoA-transferase BbsF subunit
VDIVSAYMSAVAILAALNHRAQTGEGQHIDMSSEEALSSLISDSLVESAMNGQNSQRVANQDDIMAPHQCYRCRGEDKWISIAIATNDEWLSLCRVMGNPSWITEDRFTESYSRWENQDEMDKLIDVWTVDLTNYEVMHLLQNEKVAAVPSFTSEDMYTDPNLKENEAFQTIEQPGLGDFTVMSPPWILSRTPARIRQPAPQLGEHNGYVLGKILGLSPDEQANLEIEGALE